MNVDPRLARDAKEWVEMTTLPLSALMAAVPILSDNVKWVDWAYNVVQDPSVQKHAPPDPRYFNTWQDWAYMFNQVVPL